MMTYYHLFIYLFLERKHALDPQELPEQSEVTRLSLYRDLADMSEKSFAHLVQHVESGKTYVKKELRNYDRGVFEYIKMRSIPGIPRIIDIIENFGENGRPDVLVVIEEYITGSTLREILDAYGPLKPDIALDYMLQLCHILQPLHDRKRPIVHCRISPENVMITQSGQLYLLGFDHAREIDPENPDTPTVPPTVSALSGSYIASGQYEYLPAEPQTDILECGSLLREMITGVSPASPSPRAPLMERPEVAVLEPVISKCTETRPTARYENASELLTELESITPQIVHLISARDPEARKIRLRKILTVILFIGAVLVLVYFIGNHFI